MKTAEFNLELALAGHPLVTRGGEKILSFNYGEKWNEDSVMVAVKEGGGVITLYIDGGYYRDVDSVDDMLLDLSTPWDKPLEEGDWVDVKGTSGEWGGNNDRIYICSLKNGNYLCVAIGSEERYNTGEAFATTTWLDVKKITTPSIEITVKINGKEAKLSDISDETLAKLKEV